MTPIQFSHRTARQLKFMFLGAILILLGIYSSFPLAQALKALFPWLPF